MEFQIGKRYSRSDVKQLAGLSRDAKGGDWDTGSVFHDGEYIIFTNVGTAGRTGHDYHNRWEGENLRWYHRKGSHRGWSSVQNMLKQNQMIHLFWRSQNDQPFEYAGRAFPVDVKDTSPVEILWAFDKFRDLQIPEEVPIGKYKEGATKNVLVNAYERDPDARRDCIKHYGTDCFVCGFSFGSRYGKLGQGYIHIHHVLPLSDIRVEHEIDPIDDLRPVCPNCHSMLHRRRPPFTTEELKQILGGEE